MNLGAAIKIYLFGVAFALALMIIFYCMMLPSKPFVYVGF